MPSVPAKTRSNRENGSLSLSKQALVDIDAYVSLYRARSLLVDRAVQSELTAKTVAENCLALTADAVNHVQSPDTSDDDGTRTFTPASVEARSEDKDIEVEGFHSGGMIHRRDSYQQAIIHTDSLHKAVEFEADVDVQAMRQRTLDIVSEIEEQNGDKEAKGVPEETRLVKASAVTLSPEASLDEALECEKQTCGTDASSTRADILDDGSDEFDAAVAVDEGKPTGEASHSRSASVDDGCEPENSRPMEVAACRESGDSHLPAAFPPLSEHER